MSVKYSVKKLSRAFTDDQPVVYERLGQMYELYQREGLTEVDLKNLKRLLPNWEQINYEMESLVKDGLVQRYDGRYRLKVPVLTQEQFVLLAKESETIAQQLLLALREALPLIEQEPWLVILAIEELMKSKAATFLLPEGSLPNFEISHVQSQNYLFVDLGLSEETGLASYFKQNREKPFRKEALEFIGDVNPAFFIEMSGQVLGTLVSQAKLKGIETNIFVKALAYFSYVELIEKKAEVLTPLTSRPKASLTADIVGVVEFLDTALVNTTARDELFTCLVFSELLKTMQASKFVILLTEN